MRGKRAKLAAFAAKYNHRMWRRTPNKMKYGGTKHKHAKNHLWDITILCNGYRTKYLKFKKFIKLRRSAPHSRSMGNGMIIKKLQGEKAYKRFVKARKTNDLATTAGSVMQTALQKITPKRDATAS